MKVGPTTTIRGAAKTLFWRGRNFDRHYEKHPGSANESECWADLLSHPGTSASKSEYEDASYQAVSDARLHCQYDDERHGMRDHFIDEQLVETITLNHETASPDLEIVTCFHKHFPSRGPNRYTHLTPGGFRPSEVLERVERNLDRKYQAGRIRKLRVFTGVGGAADA